MCTATTLPHPDFGHCPSRPSTWSWALKDKQEGVPQPRREGRALWAEGTAHMKAGVPSKLQAEDPARNRAPEAGCASAHVGEDGRDLQLWLGREGPGPRFPMVDGRSREAVQKGSGSSSGVEILPLSPWPMPSLGLTRFTS